MKRRCDPLSVVCPEPECRAAVGEKCNAEAKRAWEDPVSKKVSYRPLDLEIGKPETDWHFARYAAAREKALAREPVDDRPWCQRSLTSIVAELVRRGHQ